MEKHLKRLIGRQVIARLAQQVAPSPYNDQVEGILETLDTCDQVIKIGDTLINMRHAVLLSVMEMGNPRAVGAAAIMEMKAYLKELMSPLVDADAMPTIAERLLDMLQRAELENGSSANDDNAKALEQAMQSPFFCAGWHAYDAAFNAGLHTCVVPQYRDKQWQAEWSRGYVWNRDELNKQPENENGGDDTQDPFYLAGYYSTIYIKDIELFDTIALNDQHRHFIRGIEGGLNMSAMYWQSQRLSPDADDKAFGVLDLKDAWEAIRVVSEKIAATQALPTFQITLDDAATIDTGVEAIHLTQDTTMPAVVTYIAVPTFQEVLVGDRVWAKNDTGGQVKGIGIVDTKFPGICAVMFGGVCYWFSHTDYGTKWGATRQQQPVPAQEEAELSEPAAENDRPWDDLKVGDPVWVKGWSRLGSIDSIDGTCFQVVDSSGYRLPLYPDTFGTYWGIPDSPKTTEGETK
jgi:hypothetical protein